MQVDPNAGASETTSSAGTVGAKYKLPEDTDAGEDASGADGLLKSVGKSPGTFNPSAMETKASQVCGCWAFGAGACQGVLSTSALGEVTQSKAPAALHMDCNRPSHLPLCFSVVRPPSLPSIAVCGYKLF